MRTILAAALVTLALMACDYDRTWNLNLPFAPLAVDSAEIPAAQAQAAFQSAIEQLGGRIVLGAAQQVHIVYDIKCNCQTCTQRTAFHTERFSQDTIQACPLWKNMPADGLSDGVIHETGHVLGQWNHLPCEDVIMSPDYTCRKDHGTYNVQLDIPWICTGNVGGVRGGKCG